MDAFSALEGLRVLDLSRVLAGPYCTMLLADMGADVIKVERPGKGDDTRGYGPPFINGESTYFMSVNRNKRSMTLNIKHEAGRQILFDLIARADVLVENFRPGTLDRQGFGFDDLHPSYPKLIYCSVSGYGHTGPMRNVPGYDLIVQGEGGIADLTGEPDGPPMKVGTSQADIIAGMNAFQGILLALLARRQSGLGQKIDISLLDCQVSLLTYQAAIFLGTGDSPTRMGNQHPSIAPYETFAAKDGYVNVGCGNEVIWKRFCEITGNQALSEDPRFANNADRVANREALNRILEPLMKTRTVDDWVGLLRPAGVPSGPIQSVQEVLEHPQTLAREMVVPLEHPVAGDIRVTGNPIKMSLTPAQVQNAPPLLGEHTEDVLSDWLGMEAEGVAALRQAGAI